MSKQIANVYGIKDIQVGAFMMFYEQPNDIEAKRDFAVGMQNPKTRLHKWPEAFELWKLADFDPRTGGFKEDFRPLGNGPQIAQEFRLAEEMVSGQQNLFKAEKEN